MGWQSLRAFVWGILTSPFKLYKLFGFFVKATLYFFVFSFATCFLIYAFAADVPAVYVPKSYQDTPVSCTLAQSATTSGPLNSTACVSYLRTVKAYVSYEYRSFSSFVNQPNFVPGVNSSGSAIYCGNSGCSTLVYSYWGSSATYTESYSCPPPGYPDNIISNGTMCSQKICSDVGTYGGFYGYSKMPNGSGTACYMGCKYEVFKPSTEQSESGYGWYFYGGRTNGTEDKGACKCPDGSVTCWTNNFSPDGSGSSATDKTCSAYDNGEIKGVNCGENGSMSVDVGAIQESIFNSDLKIDALDANQKAMAAAMVEASIDVDKIKTEVAALKTNGCTVSPSLNGVSITCNGQTATATNGKDGVDGKDGADGVNGARGADGRDGVDGARGADGAQGIAGRDGIDGAQGADGAQGIAGRDGIDGAQGAQGVAGLAGMDGKDGAQGAAGINGVDGKNGEDGLSVTAYQDGLDAVVMSAEGVELARVAGVDKDGIISELQNSNSTLSEIKDRLSSDDAPTAVDADYGEKFKVVDPAVRNFKTVLEEHVAGMKQAPLYSAMEGFFSVSFNGDCSPITFAFTVYEHAFDVSIDPFCSLSIWPYIRAVVMCVFGFFAFRVAFDN